MVASKQSTVTERRALLTDREREIVAGDADVKDSYRYQTISRVRARFNRLGDDLDALEKHGDLADELRDIVCRTETGRVSAVTPSTDTGDRTDSSPDPPAETASSSDEFDSLTEGVDAVAGGDEPDRPNPHREAVGALGLEGAGSRLEAREAAVVDVLDYLREHGEATASDLKGRLDVDGAGYDDADSFWANLRRQDVFDTLPVETPGRGGRLYRYDAGGRET